MKQKSIQEFDDLVAARPGAGGGLVSYGWRPTIVTATSQTYSASKKIEIDRSPIGTLYRRVQYFGRYLLARTHSRTIERLLPIVEKAFEHSWVAGVELRVRFWPGSERSFGRLWRWHEDISGRSMTWDAPITVSVFRKRKGKKRQALCMSLYVVNRTLYVGQIQGVLGTDVPTELRAWPKMFIETCQTFARQEALKEVRVPRAEMLYSYRNPFLNSQLLPESRENALKKIRRNMKLLYNSNALELGFVPDGGWFKWDSKTFSAYSSPTAQRPSWGQLGCPKSAMNEHQPQVEAGQDVPKAEVECLKKQGETTKDQAELAVQHHVDCHAKKPMLLEAL